MCSREANLKCECENNANEDFWVERKPTFFMDVVLVHALHELRQVRTNMAPHEFVVCVMTGKSWLTVTKYRDKLDKAAIPFPGSPDLRNQCEPEKQRQSHSRLCSRYLRNSIEQDQSQTALEVGRGEKAWLPILYSMRQQGTAGAGATGRIQRPQLFLQEVRCAV